MRIAQVSPLMEAVPPSTYGGTERIVSALADALVWLGHEVTVFATADSVTDARLVAFRDRPILTDPRNCCDVGDHLRMLAEVRRRADDFDLIHFHTEFLQCPLFEDIAGNTVTTCHSRLDLVGLPDFYAAWPEFPLVSISNSQRQPLPDANWAATILHGLPADTYRPSPEAAGDDRGGYLAFLGRISPDKGVAQSIAIARQTGRRLKIAARINSFDQPYWEREILPQIDGAQIEYVGELDDAGKSGFLGRADAMLFPIQWPEPFGLVMIEAMACGCPVVAFDHGAVPEVIASGRTGIIVSSVEEAVARLDEVAGLDRQAIRREFESRFSAERMARDYVAVYDRLVRARTALEAARSVLSTGGRRAQLPAESALARAGVLARARPGLRKTAGEQPLE